MSRKKRLEELRGELARCQRDLVSVGAGLLAAQLASDEALNNQRALDPMNPLDAAALNEQQAKLEAAVESEDGLREAIDLLLVEKHDIEEQISNLGGTYY
jgi:hypothetical protein